MGNDILIIKAKQDNISKVEQKGRWGENTGLGQTSDLTIEQSGLL